MIRPIILRIWWIIKDWPLTLSSMYSQPSWINGSPQTSKLIICRFADISPKRSLWNFEHCPNTYLFVYPRWNYDRFWCHDKCPGVCWLLPVFLLKFYTSPALLTSFLYQRNTQSGSSSYKSDEYTYSWHRSLSSLFCGIWTAKKREKETNCVWARIRPGGIDKIPESFWRL